MESKEYRDYGLEIGLLVEEKQGAYGNSFGRSGEIMEILYPDGLSPEQVTDGLAIVRVIDKLFRIATDKDAFGESPWKDIAGYALLGWRNHDTSARKHSDMDQSRDAESAEHDCRR